MISAKFLVFGENFSGLWVNNWTKSLAFLGNNKFNCTWQFYEGKEPLIEFNHAVKNIGNTDWVVIVNNDVLWNQEQVKHLLINNTYDAISGWKFLDNGKTDIIQSLDTRSVLNNNAVNYLASGDIAVRRLPFKVEYCSLSFTAFKTSLIQNKTFSPQYIRSDKDNKEVLLPWYFSVCKQFSELGHEIFADPTLQMKTILRRIV